MLPEPEEHVETAEPDVDEVRPKPMRRAHPEAAAR